MSLRETPVSCPRCGQLTHAAMVKTAMWSGEQLVVVEDIPAQVCDSCAEQFYDEDATEALRQLVEDKTAEPKRQILVPIFSLEGRIRRRGAPPEDVYADY